METIYKHKYYEGFVANVENGDSLIKARLFNVATKDFIELFVGAPIVGEKTTSYSICAEASAIENATVGKYDLEFIGYRESFGNKPLMLSYVKNFAEVVESSIL